MSTKDATVSHDSLLEGKTNQNIQYIDSPQISHLHLYHLVFTLGAERPLIGQGIMVVCAFIAVQSDGVAWQLDDLDEVKRNTR